MTHLQLCAHTYGVCHTQTNTHECKQTSTHAVVHQIVIQILTIAMDIPFKKLQLLLELDLFELLRKFLEVSDELLM